jgi:hypothetical protein
MDTIVFLEQPASRVITAANIFLLLAVLLCIWALPSHAGQSSGQFSVNITLQASGVPPTGVSPAGTSSAPAAVLCRSGTGIGAFGTTLTVDCATGALVSAPANASSLPWTSAPDNSNRYMLNVYSDGKPLGTIDGYFGVGSVTSWRTIKLNDRDYIEMMLHW